LLWSRHKRNQRIITGNYTSFEDETGSIADEAMNRLAETDEVFAEESALCA
jgi:hypothetical protein